MQFEYPDQYYGAFGFALTSRGRRRALLGCEAASISCLNENITFARIDVV
jgi:hypothetical protein